MYARSTTVQAHQDSIDAGVAHIRDEVMPALLDMPGCIGLSMLVDRTSGRCIATSAWDSAEAMRASEDMARPMRERAAEILGNRAQVDQWEIAVLHRDHRTREGCCVRATWFRFSAGDMARAIDIYKMAMLPAMEQFDGFCSASLMVDRESGIAVSSVTYDSMDAMARTRDDADSLRLSGAREAGVEVLDVCEFELALAHLHVPEMA
ncbi:MAG: hypothetical protein GEU86_00455 [Actinophytocola sp.]|nr:hypothetical protein [Actinophytocola sp.]